MPELTGRVIKVDTELAGSALIEDASAGAGTIVLDDAGDCSATGGTLYLEDATAALGDGASQTIDYISADEDTGMVVLDGVLATNFPTDTDVTILPLAPRTTAYVETDDELEPIPAYVPQHYIVNYPDQLADGDYEGNAGVSVVIDIVDEEFQIVKVVDAQAFVDGTKIVGPIPPASVPVPAPADAPTDPPIITVGAFAIGALLTEWDVIEDAQWYDVYASLTPGFDSDDIANRVLEHVTDVRAMVSTVAGVQIPVDGTPVYIVVKAVNVVGEGPASNEASGVARQADAEYISALMGYFGSLEGREALLGNLDVTMNVDVGGVIAIGNRITIADPNAPDGKGGIIVWGDDAHTVKLVRLHPDGNYLDGILNAQEITVIQALRLIGAASAVASGAKLKLENGVADPPAPTLSAGAILNNWPAVPADYTERGIFWDAANTVWYQLLWHAADARIYVRSIDTAGSPGAMLRLTGYDDTSVVNGIIRYGASFYICERVNDGSPVWLVAKHNATTGGAQGRANLGYLGDANDTSPTTVSAVVGYDAINNLPFAAYINSNAPTTMRFDWFTITGGNTITWFASYRATISSLAAGMLKPRHLAASSFDRGTPLIQVESLEGNVHHFTLPAPLTDTGDALVRQDAHYFETGGGWLGYKSNGGTAGEPVGFYSSHSDAKLRRWSSYFPAVSEKWWAQYADTGAGAITTKVSPVSAGLAVTARRFVTVVVRPAPSTVTGADVFVGYGSSDPGTTKKKRTESLTGRTMTLTNGKDAGTTAMPATNTMGGAPASLYDDVGHEWLGDGTLRFPFARVPKWQAGAWYESQFFGSGADANTTATLNLVYYIPIIVPEACTIDEVGINVATGTASSVLNFGLYADANGVPGAKLADWGNTSAATAGGKSKTALAYAAKAGLFWLGFLVTGAATAVTKSVGVVGVTQYAGAATLTEAQSVGWHQTGQTSLPAVAASLARSSTVERPKVRVKAA